MSVLIWKDGVIDMIHTVLMVLLAILKIIGIVFLSIFGLLLLVLLAVLFVPVRYRADGAFSESERRAGVKATWLLHLISIEARSGEERKFTGKLFGIRVHPRRQKRETVFLKKRTEKRSGERTEEPGGEEMPDAAEKTEYIDKMADLDLQDMVPEPKPEEAAPADPYPKKERAAFREKIRKKTDGFCSRIKRHFDNIREALTGLCDAGKRIKEKISEIWNFFAEECTKESVPFIKKQLFLILKHIRPRKMKGSLHFGTGDPALTGQILGGISMIYGFLPDGLEITPDFDYQVLEGNFRLKGHIRLIYVVIAGIRLFFDKNVRETMEKAKLL